MTTFDDLPELTETDRKAIHDRIARKHGDVIYELVAVTPVLWSGWELDRAVALVDVGTGHSELVVLDGTRVPSSESVEAMLEVRLAEYERVTQLTRALLAHARDPKRRLHNAVLAAQQAADYFRGAKRAYARARELPDFERTMVLQGSLHFGFNAARDSLEQVLDAVGEARPSDVEYGPALLRRMTLSVPGSRPPVLSEETAKDLADVLAFYNETWTAADIPSSGLTADAVAAATRLADTLPVDINNFCALQILERAPDVPPDPDDEMPPEGNG